MKPLGEQYQGTAYLFNSSCGSLPYRVNGPILDNSRRVELRGQAPRVDSNCRVTGYVNDLLEFQLIEPTVQFSDNNKNTAPQTLEAPSQNTPTQRPTSSAPSIFPTAPADRVDTPALSVPGATQIGNTRTVEVTAIAETPDGARKEATRQAVQQVAGVFVDSRRRIELKMSDQKLSEIVEEKLLSYTNAYVTKLEVLSTEHQSDGYAIKAKVTVAIAPLLKTLQANDVPTVAFDADSAAGTAESLTIEKTNALEIYTDLLARIDGLLKVGLGKAEVATSIPSAAGWTWVSVPLTFFVNDDSLQEWKKKFGLISDKRARFLMEATLNPLARNECAFPKLQINEVKKTFLQERPGSGQEGVAACFLDRAGPTSFSTDCFGRAFVLPPVTGGQGGLWCVPGSQCLLRRSVSSIRLGLEFLGNDGEVIHSLQIPFSKFPELNFQNSRSTPHDKETAFFNYCVGEQRVFFASAYGQIEEQFGDTIFFPPAGTRINGLLNVLLPNEKIGQIASIRAAIKKGL